MKKVIFEKSILSCVLIFLICCIARVVEYFGIRTDETILAENFIHKVFGIIILVVMLVLSNSSLGNLLVMGIGYIILSGVMSIKWSVLYKMTGSLWMGIGDHLFNNIVVTNLLHVISNNEADNLQIIRILIGQLISFVLVMSFYKKRA